MSVDGASAFPVRAIDGQQPLASRAMERGPAYSFLAVTAIVLGSLCIIEGIGQVLAGYLRSPSDPLIPIYAQTPLLGMWRWGSAFGDLVAGLLLLHGGIEGVRRHAVSRQALRLATGILVIQWMIDLALWGGWCLDMFGTLHSARFYFGYTGVPPTYEPYEVLRIRAGVIAELITSTIVIVAWVLFIVTIARSRRVKDFDEPGVVNARLIPVGLAVASTRSAQSAAPQLAYMTPSTGAVRQKLHAGPVLLRTLFWAGLALGFLNGVTDLLAFLDLTTPGTGGGLFASGRLSSGTQSPVLIGLHAVGAAAALTVIIGCALGLLGQSGPGRIVLFVGLTATLLLQLAELDLKLSVTTFQMLEGRERWPAAASAVAVFLRGQIYAVICFVAFARVSTSATADN